MLAAISRIDADGHNSLKVFENDHSKYSFKALLGYLMSITMPALDKHAFDEFCSGSSTVLSIENDLPVVCAIAIEGTKQNSKPILKRFSDLIESKESENFSRALNKIDNIGHKIHRLQFARINVSRHHKV